MSPSVSNTHKSKDIGGRIKCIESNEEAIAAADVYFIHHTILSFRDRIFSLENTLVNVHI